MSVSCIEYKEDVNECIIIVKPTSVVLKIYMRIYVYTQIIQSHIDNIHLTKILSAKQSSITQYF